MATWALCDPTVDEIWLVPTHTHPFDKPLTEFALRCEMVQLAIDHLGPRARLETIEADLDGPNYTVRTVEALRAREPDVRWRWVGGADTWNARRSWAQWERLETLVEPLIVGREGWPSPAPFDDAPMFPDISSTNIRARVAQGDDIRGLVPHEVAAFIQNRGLYG